MIRFNWDDAPLMAELLRAAFVVVVIAFFIALFRDP